MESRDCIEYILSDKTRKKIAWECYKMGIDLIEEEDVFQDYCVDILRGCAKKQTVGQWMIQWMRANKWDKRAKKKKPKFVSTKALYSIGVEHPYEKYFYDGFKLVKPEYEEVLTLHYIMGMTMSEIAQKQEKTATAVLMMLRRAIRDLKKVFHYDDDMMQLH